MHTGFHLRIIASREGRAIEGFSMAGDATWAFFKRAFGEQR
jgi:hypothetical protein